MPALDWQVRNLADCIKEEVFPDEDQYRVCAFWMSSATLLAFNFCSRCLRWDSTVCLLIESAQAICFEEKPLATSCSISFSRVVNRYAEATMAASRLSSFCCVARTASRSLLFVLLPARVANCCSASFFCCVVQSRKVIKTLSSNPERVRESTNNCCVTHLHVPSACLNR